MYEGVDSYINSDPNQIRIQVNWNWIVNQIYDSFHELVEH